MTTFGDGYPLFLCFRLTHFPSKNQSGRDYLALSFVLRPLAGVLIGFLGDQLGLRWAFLPTAAVLLLSLPIIRLLPEGPTGSRETETTGGT